MNMLQEFVIPTSVQCIEDEAFYGCNDLEYVNYEGTIEQWNQIYKGYRFWTNSHLKCHAPHSGTP